ncbi:unnamed protein product [Euphydryas editha]|uniref:Peptidase S1 domain-containing protein n=1 Tax=Euphydryas editha TaxID=104508 RepID=A0AAU9TK35_EUPED|nr:unnamed protein product [Euphydryas editha]
MLSFILSTAQAAPAQSGENPWIVHLRVATNGNGLLTSCAGSIINQSWVLTTASCIANSRFIWIRYGALNIIHPELVTESTTVRNHPTADIALIGLNRVLDNTGKLLHVSTNNRAEKDNIGPISIADAAAEMPESGRVCGWGASESGTPGEILNCFDADLQVQEDGTIAAVSEEGQATEFDLGAPLVSDGVQYGVLSSVSDGQAVYVNPAQYRGWISDITGL